MKLWLTTLWMMAGCGAEDATTDVGTPRSGAGQPCAVEGCAQGLTCKGARGDRLCLPADWFAGEAGAWCYVDHDCRSGFTCDTDVPPLPYVDGRCVSAMPDT